MYGSGDRLDSRRLFRIDAVVVIVVSMFLFLVEMKAGSDPGRIGLNQVIKVESKSDNNDANSGSS